MRYSDSDLLNTTEQDLDRLDEEDLLRLVVICRDGDQKSTKKARNAWKTLVAHDIDRVRGIVAAFFHPKNPAVHIARDDVDDVVQDAYFRVVKMLPNFRGASIGEYRAAMRSCVHFACKDYCRDELGEDKQRAGSLDEEAGANGDDTRPKYEREVADHERARIEEEEALAEEVERLAERSAWLDDAIAAIEDEPKRRVLEMTRAGKTTKQIAKVLETSEANVYQLRTRALKLIAKMFEDDDGQR
jgi:RNA polymerase sigma factor (sigma-70 family)